MNEGATEDKMILFFYLLMRDKLPCGDVAGIIQEIESYKANQFYFSNSHLKEYSEELIERLKNDNSKNES